jgi:hypothetical protein
MDVRPSSVIRSHVLIHRAAAEPVITCRLSPNGGDAEVNPFESEFNGYDDEEDDEFDFLYTST